MHTEAAGIARFALDANPMGKLLWCSDVRSGQGRSGQLSHDGKALDPCRACTSARWATSSTTRDRTLPPAHRRLPPRTLSSEPMTSSSSPGDHLYFIGAAGEDAFLKRFALADPGKVETLLAGPTPSSGSSRSTGPTSTSSATTASCASRSRAAPSPKTSGWTRRSGGLGGRPRPIPRLFSTTTPT